LNVSDFEAWHPSGSPRVRAGTLTSVLGVKHGGSDDERGRECQHAAPTVGERV